MPHLSQTHLGRKPKVRLWRIVKAIIYRLKTGLQWRELPVEQFASRILMKWQSVYYHYQKWSANGSWKNLWTQVLKLNKSNLDMSSVQLDGSHTPAKRGGQAVAYQKRKSCKTTNMIFLTDKLGIPLAVSDPIAGNHHDLFEIEKSMTKIETDLRLADICTNGLFLNADAGFDSISFRTFCETIHVIANIDINKRNSKNTDFDYLLDEQLYKERFVVERTNAWIDAFKMLLTRYEVRAQNWASLHYLAFALILLRKVNPQYF